MACEAPYYLNKPSLTVVTKVTEAIHKRKALIINHVPLSSGEATREIVPHTLVTMAYAGTLVVLTASIVNSETLY